MGGRAGQQMDRVVEWWTMGQRWNADDGARRGDMLVTNSSYRHVMVGTARDSGEGTNHTLCVVVSVMEIGHDSKTTDNGWRTANDGRWWQMTGELQAMCVAATGGWRTVLDR